MTRHDKMQMTLTYDCRVGVHFPDESETGRGCFIQRGVNLKRRHVRNA